MKKKFVPYEESLKLKQLGFDEKCFAWFDNSNDNELELQKPTKNSKDFTKSSKHCTAPLWQDAFEWFRDQKGLYVDIFVDDDKTFGFMITYFVEEGRVDKPIQREYKSYYEAQLACIRKLIG